jgi:peptidoglycan hydrolase CwlO-like protein
MKKVIMFAFIVLSLCTTFQGQSIKQKGHNVNEDRVRPRTHINDESSRLTAQIRSEKRIEREIESLKQRLAKLQEKQIALRKSINENIDKEIKELGLSKEKEIKATSEKRERRISELKKEKENLSKEWK